MKKLFTLFAMVMASAMIFATSSYTIKFKTADADGSSAFKTTTDLKTIIESGADKVESITATNNTYAGIKGLKFSSGSANGSLELKLTDKVRITTIEVVASNWASAKGKVDAGTAVNINDKGAQELGSETDAQTLTFDINESTDVLKISATKRIYVASVTVTVDTDSEAIPVTGVTLDQSEIALEEGQSATLVATVEPANADVRDVVWSSSNESVAQVNAGVVVAVGVGEAVITVTTVDQEKTATAKVTVTEASALNTYVPTDVDNIKDDDVVIVTMTAIVDDVEVVYAMENEGATNGGPAAIKQVLVDGKIKNAASNVLWNLVKSGEGHIFYPAGQTETWLYSLASSSNNPLRLGNKEDLPNVIKVVEVETEVSPYMSIHIVPSEGDEYDRYIGVYNGDNFRAYTTVNNNIKEQTLRFFVKGRSDENTPTMVEDVVENVKVLDLNAPMFNVLGQKVDAQYKGVVIQNGHKFLLK